MASIVECLPPKMYTNVRSFTSLMGHYRCFIKGFAKIAVPLYDLTSGDNKDKKSEPVTLSLEALEVFETLKQKCVQAPILSLPDFKKPFLLETDTSGKGLGAVLSQKQDNGHYHTIAFVSQVLTEMEQRYAWSQSLMLLSTTHLGSGPHGTVWPIGALACSSQ